MKSFFFRLFCAQTSESESESEDNNLSSMHEAQSFKYINATKQYQGIISINMCLLPPFKKRGAQTIHWEMAYPLESSNSSGGGNILPVKIKIKCCARQNLEIMTFRYLKTLVYDIFFFKKYNIIGCFQF